MGFKASRRRFKLVLRCFERLEGLRKGYRWGLEDGKGWEGGIGGDWRIGRGVGGNMGVYLEVRDW